MAGRRVLLDEFQVAILVPRDLPDDTIQAAVRRLKLAKLRATVRRTIERFLHASPALRSARVRVTS